MNLGNSSNMIMFVSLLNTFNASNIFWDTSASCKNLIYTHIYYFENVRIERTVKVPASQNSVSFNTNVIRLIEI